MSPYHFSVHLVHSLCLNPKWQRHVCYVCCCNDQQVALTNNHFAPHDQLRGVGGEVGGKSHVVVNTCTVSDKSHVVANTCTVTTSFFHSFVGWLLSLLLLFVDCSLLLVQCCCWLDGQFVRRLLSVDVVIAVCWSSLLCWR